MTIDRPVEFKVTVERSRFFALLFPVADEAALEDAVRRQKREHHRARHHCWACRIAAPGGQVIEKSKDDGEVGHPGRVMLEILRRHELLGGIVVSRVFGGVKLGVGGVSRAFRDAAQGAVDQYTTS